MKSVLLLASVITIHPLVNEDAALEPSIYNEVEAALSRATNRNELSSVSCGTKLPIETNLLTRTELAIKLVSRQRGDGRWMSGTNDYTAAAVKILKELLR